jgi:hypothetical protein
MEEERRETEFIEKFSCACAVNHYEWVLCMLLHKAEAVTRTFSVTD